jgi:hypothetical protein
MTTSTVKKTKSKPTYEGLYLKTKAQLMIKLGYSEQQASEYAEKVARIYERAFCHNKN